MFSYVRILKATLVGKLMPLTKRNPNMFELKQYSPSMHYVLHFLECSTSWELHVVENEHLAPSTSEISIGI